MEMEGNKMAMNEVFELNDGPEWLRGFRNLVLTEIPSWFRTMKWWGQFIWVFLMSNVILIFTFLGGETAETLMLYNVFQGLYPVFGILIVMQSTMIGEKQSGTAAWILSKPVSRTGFILAKFVINALASTLFIIILPGIIGYLEITLIGGIEVSFLGFFLGNVALWLHMMFFLTMSLLVGTLFNTRRAVLTVGITFFILEVLLIGMLPPELFVATLAFPEPNMSIAESLMIGAPIFSIWPIIIAIISCIIFVLLAIWRFKKEEF
jgi:ABC-2 type transport system permease protein